VRGRCRVPHHPPSSNAISHTRHVVRSYQIDPLETSGGGKMRNHVYCVLHVSGDAVVVTPR